MKLTMQDASRLLGAPERTIERWIHEESMPAQRIHGQYRFHPSELVEWAHERGIRIGDGAPAAPRRGEGAPGFADALAAGGIHHHVSAEDRDSLIRAVVDRLPIDAGADRDLLFEVIRAREDAGTTGIGDGIAIPHVRTPIVLDVDRPSVSLCFLDRPVDFHAVDKKPVHTVFLLVTSSNASHLSLLSRLAAAMHDEGFRRAVLARAPAHVILNEARRVEGA